jgi:LuxR family maltose regulon positive regulatory protein
LGELEREWNNLDAACSYLQEGLRLGRLADNGLILISGMITMARVKQAQGDFAAALDHIHQIEELTRGAVATWTWMTVSNVAYLARLWVRQGQLEKANDLVQAFQQTGTPAYIAQGQNLATITLRLAQGRTSDALSIIEKMKPDLIQSGQNGILVELLVLQSLALVALKRPSDALEALVSAINLAEPESYQRLFLDAGNDIPLLLRQLPQTSYLEQLLEHFPPADEATAIPQGQLSPPAPPQTLIDPLSDRELQILRLMSARLSNPEIAAELYLATTTIKWYSRQIYSKLDVNSRRAAVERAEELNLL